MGYSSAPALTQAIVYSPRPKLIALIALLRPSPGSPSIRFPQEKIPRSLSAGNIFAAQIFTGAGNSPAFSLLFARLAASAVIANGRKEMIRLTAVAFALALVLSR